MSAEKRKNNVRVYLYVPHSWVEKALSLGWENPSDLGPPHNSYSVLMEWMGEGEPVMPFRSTEKVYEHRR